MINTICQLNKTIPHLTKRSGDGHFLNRAMSFETSSHRIEAAVGCRRVPLAPPPPPPSSVWQTCHRRLLPTHFGVCVCFWSCLGFVWYGDAALLHSSCGWNLGRASVCALRCCRCCCTYGLRVRMVISAVVGNVAMFAAKCVGDCWRVMRWVVGLVLVLVLSDLRYIYIYT